MTAPAIFTWEGDCFRPLKRFERQCDRDFVIGQQYRMVEQEERSMASHGHYFAALHEAWQNLPEDIAERFPTVDHLRRFALIKAGYSDSQTLVAASKAEAVRLASFIRPIDEFSVVTVQETTVTRFTARSQSMRAMGRAEFGASKQAVLDIVAAMVGVPTDQIEKERAA